MGDAKLGLGDGGRQGHEGTADHELKIMIPPPKTNMEPENDGF